LLIDALPSASTLYSIALASALNFSASLSLLAVIIALSAKPCAKIL
jgi:hypothetical protein